MTSPQNPNKEKFDTLNKLLGDEYVLAHVNPECDGVALPVHLKTNHTVTLKLSRLFRGKIDVTNECISADLLFGDEYFTCVIPLPALWGVTSIKGSNILWPESTPEAILKSLMAEQNNQPPPPPSSEGDKRPQLRRIK